VSEVSEQLEADAIECRRLGRFEEAANRFGAASETADDPARQVNMRVRQAVCLAMIERSDESFAVARDVVPAARADGLVHELVDALGLVADHHIRSGSFAAAADALSEAIDLVDRLPDDPDHARANHMTLHNLAASLEHCGFVHQSIELFRRALDTAPDREHADFTRASTISALHFAAALTDDPAERKRHVVAGLALLGEVDVDASELHASVSALAHGSMLLAHAGEYETAIETACRAAELATAHDLGEDAMLASAADCTANWHLHRSPGILERVEATLAIADTLNRRDVLSILEAVHVEILWSSGDHDGARRVLEQQLVEARRRTAAERQVRWQHVALGIEHRRVSTLSDTDPLTGLHNRRHLERVLPTLLDAADRLVVALVDLDGFKQVNDRLGYARGDAVICEVADLLEGVCRRGDLLVRLGGDEFVIAFRDLDEDSAVRVFERIRLVVAEHRFTGIPDEVALSASVGVIRFTAGHDLDLRETLAAAANAMHESKKAGKNRITYVEV
jgi:diguanylate cyclase (GGDEF)-like protein